MNTAFSDVAEDSVRALVADSPLAWLVPAAAPEEARLMPCLPVEQGKFRIEGHLPIAAPITAILRTDPRLTILFKGPDAYISPRVVGDERWGPTWNFASVALRGTVDFQEHRTQSIVKRLTAHMEGSNDPEWIARRMGDRFDLLSKRIVGFEFTVEVCKPRFKLGQDETEETRQKIMNHFPDSPLGAAMRRQDDQT
ncbi:FMN-binding negative transcriptional regulator [Croceicoccus sediminis]|uniref:FMN-binding negative transcriptional regulator n=1 Tax=Croceicoccus sediminis TaxID=2571150 RepID=UPI00118211CC|nr:FMN-binding negative transcriptional regulator [Croceicoccus sediminis]